MSDKNNIFTLYLYSTYWIDGFYEIFHYPHPVQKQ